MSSSQLTKSYFSEGRAQPPTRWYLRVTQPFDHLRKLAAGLCWKFGCPDEATRWKKSLWSLLNRLSFEMEWHDVETYVSCGRKLSLDPDIQSWSIHFFSESFGQFGTQRFQRSLWSFLCVLFWLVILEQVSQNSIRGTQVSAYHCYSLHIWSFIVYIYTQYIYIYTVNIHTLYIQITYIIIHSPSISTAFAYLLSKVMPGTPQSEVVMIASLTSRRLGLGGP